MRSETTGAIAKQERRILARLLSRTEFLITLLSSQISTKMLCFSTDGSCDRLWRLVFVMDSGIPGPGFLIVSRMPINPPHSEA
jgi:hypothetical protein